MINNDKTIAIRTKQKQKYDYNYYNHNTYTTYKAYKGKKHGKNHYNIYETRHVNVLSCLSKNHSSPFNQNVYVRLCEEKEAFNFSSNALQF